MIVSPFSHILKDAQERLKKFVERFDSKKYDSDECIWPYFLHKTTGIPQEIEDVFLSNSTFRSDVYKKLTPEGCIATIRSICIPNMGYVGNSFIKPPEIMSYDKTTNIVTIAGRSLYPKYSPHADILFFISPYDGNLLRSDFINIIDYGKQLFKQRRYPDDRYQSFLKPYNIAIKRNDSKAGLFPREIIGTQPFMEITHLAPNLGYLHE